MINIKEYKRDVSNSFIAPYFLEEHMIAMKNFSEDEIGATKEDYLKNQKKYLDVLVHYINEIKKIDRAIFMGRRIDDKERICFNTIGASIDETLDSIQYDILNYLAICNDNINQDTLKVNDYYKEFSQNINNAFNDFDEETKSVMINESLVLFDGLLSETEKMFDDETFEENRRADDLSSTLRQDFKIGLISQFEELKKSLKWKQRQAVLPRLRQVMGLKTYTLFDQNNAIMTKNGKSLDKLGDQMAYYLKLIKDSDLDEYDKSWARDELSFQYQVALGNVYSKIEPMVIYLNNMKHFSRSV